MKLGLLSLIFFFSLTTLTNAQQVRISNVTNSGNASEIVLAGADRDQVWSVIQDGGDLSVNNGTIELSGVLSFDLSPDRRHFAVLLEDEGHHVHIFNHQGYLVGKYSDIPDVDPSDPSLKLFLIKDGAIVIRDNIVAFAIYNQSQLFVDRISNSSGSPLGETISRISTSVDGRFTYVYNPQIKINDGFGSRLSRLSEDGVFTTLFHDDEREIAGLSVMESGNQVVAVFRNGADVVMRIIDAEQGVIKESAAPMEQAGFYIQPEHGTITWFSGNAAQVYSLETGERLANAFLRNQNIIFAMFEPTDNLVVTLTGSRSYQNRTLTVNAVRVVDLTARSILHSAEVNRVLEYSDEISPSVVRIGANRYRLTGVTNAFDIAVTR